MLTELRTMRTWLNERPDVFQFLRPLASRDLIDDGGWASQQQCDNVQDCRLAAGDLPVRARQYWDLDGLVDAVSEHEQYFAKSFKQSGCDRLGHS